MIVAAKGSLGGGKGPDGRSRGNGLIRQRERLQRQVVIGHCVQQLLANLSRRNIALHKAGLGLPVAFIVSEYENPVLPDRTSDGSSKLVKREAGLLTNPLKSRV